VTRAREQLPANERVWADIADADLLFLTLSVDELLADHAGAGLPRRRPTERPRLGCHLATGVRPLGLRADAVQAVTNDFDGPKETMTTRRTAPHLVVFTGTHRLMRAALPGQRRRQCARSSLSG
jgi:hypothetical protein